MFKDLHEPPRTGFRYLHPSRAENCTLCIYDNDVIHNDVIHSFFAFLTGLELRFPKPSLDFALYSLLSTRKSQNRARRDWRAPGKPLFIL